MNILIFEICTPHTLEIIIEGNTFNLVKIFNEFI